MSRKYFAPAVLLLSLLLLLNDAAAFRLDLFFECLARLGMLVLAALMLRKWLAEARYEGQRRLLLCGLLGLSLDVYWQLAYSGAFQWFAMLLKFAGVATGLMCFIALTASFGNGARGTRFRVVLRLVAPLMGLVVFIAGVALGFGWMAHCRSGAGGCYVDDAFSIWSYRAYFIADSTARLLIFAAALAAVITSPENRQRLLLVAVSCMLLAAGTAIDFTVRLATVPPDTVFALQVLDAILTLLFVLGMFVAITKNRMFDVAFYFSGGIVYGAVFVLALIVNLAMQRILLAAAARRTGRAPRVRRRSAIVSCGAPPNAPDRDLRRRHGALQ